MSEKITWTHVDAHVRREHDRRGMLPTGMTDAEVTKSYITWLERMLLSAQRTLEGSQHELESTRQQLAEALTTKPSKTKQRLANLEKEVLRLGKMLEDPPIDLPFDINKCANRHCQSKAREISPYCEKCEPDL